MTSMIAALKDDLLARLDETRWKIAAGYDPEEELSLLAEDIVRRCDEADTLYRDAMKWMW